MTPSVNTFVSYETVTGGLNPAIYGGYKFFWYNRWPSRFNAKLNFLWYDVIVIENLGGSEIREWFLGDEALRATELSYFDNAIVPSSSVGDGAVNQARLQRGLEGDSPLMGDLGEEGYNFVAPANPHQFAYNSLFDAYERRLGIGELTGGDFHQAEGQAAIAIDAIRTWSHLNEFLGCQLFCNPDEEIALNAMLKFAAQEEATEVTTSKLVHRVATLVLPDVSAISWKELIAIKKDRGFGQLRERIVEVAQTQKDAELAAAAFKKEVRQLGRNIIAKATPRPIKTLVHEIATNLPVGLFNPYSIFSGYKKFLSQCHEATNRQWIYTFNDLEQRVEAAASSSSSVTLPPTFIQLQLESGG